MKKEKYFLPITFSLIIGILGISFFFKTDNKVSVSERRELYTRRNITDYKVMDGSLFEYFEKYLLDQIPLRENFRRLKSINTYYIYKKLDNHDIIVKDNHATKLSYEIDDNDINLYIKKINQIINKKINKENVNIYHSVIPDKNYYLIRNKEYPLLDYENLVKNVKSINGKYIDIFEELSLDSYYYTDSHWKEDSIIPVANKILKNMNSEEIKNSKISTSLKPFYGIYYGESALPLKSEEIRYVTTTEIEYSTFYRYDSKSETFNKSNIYDIEKFNNKLVDSYDIFLGGASTIDYFDNKLVNNNKRLYIFSDSFGRSIAPLLLSNYNKVVLYDIRYMNVDTALKIMPIEENADVLFLYSTTSIDVSNNLQVGD